MELREVDRCCCVVSLAEAFSTKTPISCSGVVVHPQTGTVICSGLPFSRFITDVGPPPSDSGFLSPHSFSERLNIRVSLPACSSSARGSLRAQSALHRVVPAELLLLVNCPEFQQAFQSVFQEADQWRFHAGEEDEELARDAQFLSWFAVLRTSVVLGDSSAVRTTPCQSSASLRKGAPVVACGSPFGSLCLDLFIGTLSRGIISNLSGEDNAVILTDARCLPGTEGGGLFLMNSPSDVRLIGVIVSPFGWKATEWIGLSLVCSVHLIFRNIISCRKVQEPIWDEWLFPGDDRLHMSATALQPAAVEHPIVCLVDSGQLWGSGVVVSPQLVITCRHVVNGKSRVTLKFHHMDRVLNMVADVLFSTNDSSPYDLAVVQLRESFAGASVPQMATSFYPGDPVVVVGFGGIGRHCGPSLTCGVLSKAISLEDKPVMLQTTCAVQAGTSGGAVVHRHTGKLLGIVSSNTKDVTAKVLYPHLNYSIPVSVFQAALQHYEKTKDSSVFRVLDTTEERVRRVWRLQVTQSKM